MAYLNQRLLRLPNAIGVMIIAITISLAFILFNRIYPGFFQETLKMLDTVDFSEVLIVSLWMVNVGDTNAVGWINNVFFQKIAPGAVGSLLFAVVYMLICWCVGKILDKNKVYIRV